MEEEVTIRNVQRQIKINSILCRFCVDVGSIFRNDGIFKFFTQGMEFLRILESTHA